MSTIFALLGLFLLILDAKTAFKSAHEGIQLCINSLLPVLLPFSILIKIICNKLVGQKIRCLQTLERLTETPDGAGAILLLGSIGGYPLGAQCVDDAYRNGAIQKSAARRMLAYCSNAGPAFIFGILGPLLGSLGVSVLLLLIHIISAILVSIFLPRRGHEVCCMTETKGLSITNILENAIKSIGIICCWVVLFRILSGFLEKWVLWFLPESISVLIIGFLELSNGCLLISKIGDAGSRFIISACILGFGGLCVLLQTLSCTKSCGIGWYFPGKLMHGSISFILAYLVQGVLFSGTDRSNLHYSTLFIPLVILIITGSFFIKQKKIVAIPQQM